VVPCGIGRCARRGADGGRAVAFTDGRRGSWDGWRSEKLDGGLVERGGSLGEPEEAAVVDELGRGDVPRRERSCGPGRARGSVCG